MSELFKGQSPEDSAPFKGEKENEHQLSPEQDAVVDAGVEHVAEAMASADELIAKIDETIKDGQEVNDSPEAEATKGDLIAIREEVHSLRNKFIEGSYMFLRLAVLAGAFLAARDIGMRVDTPDFAKRDEARETLKKEGITKEQRWAYIPGVSNLVQKMVVPAGYSIPTAKDLFKDFFEADQEAIPNREDAWRLYLGMPQKHDTFGISQYKPQHAKEDIYYYKINGFFKKWAASDGESNLSQTFGTGDKENKEDSGMTDQQKKDITKLIKYVVEMEIGDGRDKIVADDDIAGIMGDFKVSKGHDENGDYISYYDLWDLDVGSEKNEGLLGKPFEIYDRIYYNPKTFEPIEISALEK
jgi:hypothetical protein